MELNRRNFLQKVGGTAGALAFAPFLQPALARSLEAAQKRLEGLSPEAIAKDEDFWRLINQSYTASPSLLNLNNGGVSPQPKVVQEAFERYNRYSNEGPSMYMWRVLDSGREPLRKNLANLAGCSAEEIAIQRNTTEALETVIFGLRLKKGDEVILCKQDYPNMMNAWKQREQRDGIVLKWLDFDLPIEDDERIVNAYIQAFTKNTKVVHITHMLSWTGQIMPAKKIVAAARLRGIESVVDAAHSFAHINFKISDIDPDYLGTSLHKWLCAPFGTGLLYVKRSKIKNLWPLFANGDPESEDIRKFESLGTRSFPAEQAIGQAINFHEYIGSQRKEARLFYLKQYWVEKAQKEIPDIGFASPLHPAYSCAICTVYADGVNEGKLAQFLYNTQNRIHVGIVNHEKIHGIRVTPHVYTLTRDLDRFVRVLKEGIESLRADKKG